MLGRTDALAQKKGGVVRIANLGEPPTLDAHWTTATLTEVLTNHLYEGLYALDEGTARFPMLAEALPGLAGRAHLRSGSAEDQVPQRQGDDVGRRRGLPQALDAAGQYGRALGAVLAEMKRRASTPSSSPQAEMRGGRGEPRGAQQLRRHLPEGDRREVPAGRRRPSSSGRGRSSSPSGSRTSTSGWSASTTTSLGEKTNGYGGAKTVWVDEIRWISGARRRHRVAQMETGELDFADDLNIDAFDRLQRSPNARPVVAKYYWLVAVLNKKEGLMTNQKLRQAWQAAIDIEPIMKAVAGGRSEFYRMDAGLAFVENAPWYVKPRRPGAGTSGTRTRPRSSCRRPATRASPSGS